MTKGKKKWLTVAIRVAVVSAVAAAATQAPPAAIDPLQELVAVLLAGVE